MKQILSFLLLVIAIEYCHSQSSTAKINYTHQDTLRGSVTEERAWWDLLHYNIALSVDPSTQTIKGKNIIEYKVLENNNVMQIDLQSPLIINKIVQKGEILKFRSDGPAHFIYLKEKQIPGEICEISVEFSGKPHVAENPPWDGGFIWSRDKDNNHFIATSCQGIGASIWWPCKDHMYDEPDNGVFISVNVPENLVAVANGRLQNVKKEDNKTKTYSWNVINPINSYGVAINIGNYVNFSDEYNGENGKLDMDYWVLSDNLDIAKVHFKDALRMMEAFEYWFGPYPFYEDSYKLVETPYLGMEHQSCIGYGNGYQNGYRGTDISNTGWGKKFDFIIIHESGHEWFANNITYKDIADMWIHESFTSYSEALFLEYFYGKDAAAEYTINTSYGIGNIKPMISDYGVNSSPTNDIYNKGKKMLHTLRQIVNNDSKWRSMLRGLNVHFKHKTVTSKQIENFMAETLVLDLEKFFDQYLRNPEIPVFEYQIKNNELIYNWSNCIEGFNMPLEVIIDDEQHLLTFNVKGKNIKKLKNKETHDLRVDADYYVYTREIKK